jgi:hypothetical protein
MKGRLYLTSFDLSKSGLSYRKWITPSTEIVKRDEEGRAYIEVGDAESICVSFPIDSPMGLLIAAEKELMEEKEEA